MVEDLLGAEDGLHHAEDSRHHLQVGRRQYHRDEPEHLFLFVLQQVTQVLPVFGELAEYVLDDFRVVLEEPQKAAEDSLLEEDAVHVAGEDVLEDGEGVGTHVGPVQGLYVAGHLEEELEGEGDLFDGDDLGGKFKDFAEQDAALVDEFVVADAADTHGKIGNYLQIDYEVKGGFGLEEIVESLGYDPEDGVVAGVEGLDELFGCVLVEDDIGVEEDIAEDVDRQVLQFLSRWGVLEVDEFGQGLSLEIGLQVVTGTEVQKGDQAFLYSWVVFSTELGKAKVDILDREVLERGRGRFQHQFLLEFKGKQFTFILFYHLVLCFPVNEGPYFRRDVYRNMCPYRGAGIKNPDRDGFHGQERLYMLDDQFGICRGQERGIERTEAKNSLYSRSHILSSLLTDKSVAYISC